MGFWTVKPAYTPLRVNLRQARYRALIGVGGIGGGVFFALDGNHTLGREESRSGRFLDRRDYCKLHIIAHYVKVLLGPEFAVIPIGRVGDDAIGRRLLEEMAHVGLDLRYVRALPGEQTLYSICLVYPDGSGGNLTVNDSACQRVDHTVVSEAEAEFARYAGRGIALAVPEVPLEARLRLLELGTQYRFLRVAAFTTGEIRAPRAREMLRQTDLVAMNVSEAAALAGVPEETAPRAVVEAALAALGEVGDGMMVSITAGREGSWSWDGRELAHVPALPVEVVSTAGAGDAHLAGILVGLVAGLDLRQAQELGTLVAALSVTSPHTIAPEVDYEGLRLLAQSLRLPLAEPIRGLLGMEG